jgi:hypothetical protein
MSAQALQPKPLRPGRRPFPVIRPYLTSSPIRHACRSIVFASQSR